MVIGQLLSTSPVLLADTLNGHTTPNYVIHVFSFLVDIFPIQLEPQPSYVYNWAGNSLNDNINSVLSLVWK